MSGVDTGPKGLNIKPDLRAEDGERYIFKLYITGAAPSSLRAVVNVRKFCETYLAGRFEMEIIDIFKDPQIAKAAELIAAPTLVKELPLPVRRFIGDMSKTEKLLAGLDIT
jgi:circadian clock protein KaiB